jgi:hypothetical protein
MPVISVDEAFSELLSRIELNSMRVALASQRYNAVKASIEQVLPGNLTSSWLIPTQDQN